MSFINQVKAKFFEILKDKAVFYLLLYKVWQVISGLGTVYFLTDNLTEKVQGYYYTFLSVLGLQAFFELGLFVIIVNFCSHEWAGLELDEQRNIQGESENLSRLVGFARDIFKWYGACSFLFIVIVTIVGLFFFPIEEASLWRGPWIFLVLFSGLGLFALPFISILEGCGQVSTVSRFRLSQGVVSSLLLWVSLSLGAGLWSVVISTGVIFFRDLYLLLIYYRSFFKPFWSIKVTYRINWMKEVWPLQWRLGLQSIAGYFLLQIMNPVIFKYHGAEAAGRIGITMQIIYSIQSFGQAILSARVPHFGRLIASEKKFEFNSLWKKTSILSVSVVVFIGLAFVISIPIGQYLGINMFTRLASIKEIFVLISAIILSQLVQVEAAYLRAFKIEPFLKVGVLGGIIAGLLIWYFGYKYAVPGAVGAYFTSMFLVFIWSSFIFFACKKELNK